MPILKSDKIDIKTVIVIIIKNNYILINIINKLPLRKIKTSIKI